MKFLSRATLPKLCLERRTRTVRVNPRTKIVTLRETVWTVELSLPSVFGGIRAAYQRFIDTLQAALLPRVYAL